MAASQQQQHHHHRQNQQCSRFIMSKCLFKAKQKTETTNSESERIWQKMKCWTKLNADTETTVCIVVCIQFSLHHIATPTSRREKRNHSITSKQANETNEKSRETKTKQNKAYTHFAHTTARYEAQTKQFQSNNKQQNVKLREYCLCTCVFIHNSLAHTQRGFYIWIKWHGKLYSNILFTLRCLGHDCHTIFVRTHKKRIDNFDRCNWKQRCAFGPYFIMIAVVVFVLLFFHFVCVIIHLIWIHGNNIINNNDPLCFNHFYNQRKNWIQPSWKSIAMLVKWALARRVDRFLSRLFAFHLFSLCVRYIFLKRFSIIYSNEKLKRSNVQ